MIYSILSQWIVSQLLSGSYGDWAIKNSLVICSGFNTGYKSSEPLEPLLFYAMLSMQQVK